MLLKFIHNKGFVKLLWILRKELVTEDIDMHVAASAVLAMVSLTESTCCPLHVVSQYVNAMLRPNSQVRLLCSLCLMFVGSKIPFTTVVSQDMSPVLFKRPL